MGVQTFKVAGHVGLAFLKQPKNKNILLIAISIGETFFIHWFTDPPTLIFRK
jgi:hypothetical protein